MIWNSYPKPYVDLIANHPHMQLAISLSFVKLLWPLVRFISYSYDQDHVHIHTICYASTLGASTPLIHPQNKTPCLCMTPISENCIKDMGLCKKKKRNKRCIPKEDMPHASACQKKEGENKRSIPKEGMPHASACQKKKRDSPYPKRTRDGSY